MTAAVWSVTALARAASSPYGTKVTSPGRGSKGARYASFDVSASEPMVRPWNEPSAATRCVRPVRRVSLKAASLASVPELVKNTRPSAPTSDSSRSASSTWGALVKKFETWPSVVSCSVTAATRAGWAWPRALTAMPPSRSTYSLPSASQTCAPSPRARTSFGGPKVFMTAPA
jgi:hypothetical protein